MILILRQILTILKFSKFWFTISFAIILLILKFSKF
jgi:hypothetical protein